MSDQMIIQRKAKKKLPALYLDKLKEIMFVEEGIYKEPAALTEADKVFLRARFSYLSKEEKELYGFILKEAAEAKAEEVVVEESQAKAHEKVVNNMAKELREAKQKAKDEMETFKKKAKEDLKVAQDALKKANKDK